MVYVGYRSRWTLGALGAILFGVITFACSTFGDEKEDGGGGPDAASSEVVADAPGGDGSSADASPDGEPPSFVAPACPRAKPPACVTSGSGCNAEELYRPQGAPT